MHGCICVDNHCLWQGKTQSTCPFPVFFYNFYLNVGLFQNLCQIKCHCTAACNHNILYGADGSKLTFLIERRNLASRHNDRNGVAGTQDAVTVWNNDFVVMFQNANQDFTIKFFGKIHDLHIVKRRVFRDCHAQQIYTTLGKGVDFHSVRNLNETRNLLCSRIFRIDNQGDAGTGFEIFNLRKIFRIAHTGDGAAVAGLFCNQAA